MNQVRIREVAIPIRSPIAVQTPNTCHSIKCLSLFILLKYRNSLKPTNFTNPINRLLACSHLVLALYQALTKNKQNKFVMVFDLDLVKKLYGQLPGKVDAARKLVGKPLTLAEKILYAHLFEAPDRAYVRGKDYVDFAPDRVAMQDATAQMALLQFMSCGRDKVAVPSTVHCDHLLQDK